MVIRREREPLPEDRDARTYPGTPTTPPNVPLRDPAIDREAGALEGEPVERRAEARPVASRAAAPPVESRPVAPPVVPAPTAAPPPPPLASRPAAEPLGGRDVERETAAPPPAPAAAVAGAKPGREEGYHVLSTLMGWGAASFFTLLVGAILGGLFGTAAFTAGDTTAQQAAVGSIVILLVSLAVGFFLGGYTAGRMAGYKGGLHGLGVVGWAILAAVLVAVIGGAVAARVDVLGAVAPGFDAAQFTGESLVALILGLAVALGAAYFGGVVGDRSWLGPAALRHARTMRRRGRPF